jgi:hypothetical protein
MMSHSGLRVRSLASPVSTAATATKQATHAHNHYNRLPQLHTRARSSVVEAQPSLEREPQLLLLPVSPAVDMVEPEAMLESYSALHWRKPSAQSLLLQSARPSLTTEKGRFDVQLNEPPKPPGRDKHQDFYANVGDAIRTLREDIPLLFVKELNCTLPLCLMCNFCVTELSFTPCCALAHVQGRFTVMTSSSATQTSVSRA